MKDDQIKAFAQMPEPEDERVSAMLKKSRRRQTSTCASNLNWKCA